MKINLRFLSIIASLSLVAFMVQGADCEETPTPDTDAVQRKAQERILAEGNAQAGMPAIKNFRERKILKDILELRDQSNLVTYTYLYNEMPAKIPGVTALGGRLTFLGISVGYGIPYATQYTNPQKAEVSKGVSSYSQYAATSIPQADPNGLFSPSSAEGTWILLSDGKGGTKPVYVEPRIVTTPFKFQEDK